MMDSPNGVELLDEDRQPGEGLSVDGIIHAWQRVRAQLDSQCQQQGHWHGQLSTSALSTATAISALAIVRQQESDSYRKRSAEIDRAIDVACNWLLSAQNSDGGFGDTNLSHSNIATSLLVLAAWKLADFNHSEAAGHSPQAAIARGWEYCERVGKWDALRRRYGKDKTFVVPILTNCALAGIVAWDDVPSLPFEAAWLPQSWYRLARMPVVSYAVPALVAIGQVKFYHRPLHGPWGMLRRAAIEPTLRVLERMQPSSGGYLEAVPLTSFVLMSLAASQRSQHPVAVRAIDFLLASRLNDGSLPIDTNLATWTTSLSISALDYGRHIPANAPPNTALPRDAAIHSAISSSAISNSAISHPAPGFRVTEDRVLDRGDEVSPSVLRWLLSCQHWSAHPFTGAKPGGWGWSNLSGAVPDADDTPAALIALARWSRRHAGRWPMLDMQIRHSVAQGLHWLLGLQNRDGGWPTFCRGWGKLPFDRSGSDLTAHALRALGYWRREIDGSDELRTRLSRSSIDRATRRGFEFLTKSQNPDGSWFPLWFGNQDHASEENPVYGTAKVLMAFADYEKREVASQRGIDYLIRNQNADGGWGGGISVPYRVGNGATDQPGSSVEETGAALEALLVCGGSTPDWKPTIMRGLRWLVAAVEEECFLTSWPIGFYFAKLWYHERLYPIIATIAALGAALERSELWSKSP